MTLYPLIHLLSDGQFQTGTLLGEQLGISRTAVWKQVKQLPSLGFEVITKKNVGYCLARPLQLLDVEALQAELLAAKSSLWLSFVPVIDSTNAELIRRLATEAALPLGIKGHNVEDQTIQNKPSNALMLAEMQTAGRGRRGRSWFSPYAASLSLSISFQMEGGANVLQGLSLAVGVVVKEVLETQGILGVQLKWPNDLYLSTAEHVNGAKLGGILIELSGDLAGPCNVVVGLGLNVFRTQPPEAIDQPLAFLSDVIEETAICRTRLAAKLALALEQLLSNFAAEGFRPWQAGWNAAHVWAGQAASIITPSQQVQVVLGGVTATGELQVTYNDGSSGLINAGEVSVRARE